MFSANQRNSAKNHQIEGVTPATLRVAIVFFLSVIYFAGEIYFWGSEYYAGSPPYPLMVIVSLILGFVAYQYLLKKEPERTDAKTYGLMACIGFALFSYAFLLRLNIVTDNQGLHNYRYQLTADLTWQSDESVPTLDLYMPSSEYWQQYEVGDETTFQLRQGGLGIWQVNMDKVYDQQKLFYDCDGMLSCMLEGTPFESE
jgi:hypothetical protein